MRYRVIIDSMAIPDADVRINSGVTIAREAVPRAAWRRLQDLLFACDLAAQGKKHSMCVYTAASDLAELRKMGVHARIVKDDEPGRP